MNDKNFNSISQFEVPKSWIDDALNATPDSSKKIIPLTKLTRTLATVASVVLVCGIGVSLFFMADDPEIPPTKPVSSSYASLNESTDEKNPTSDKQKPTHKDDDKNNKVNSTENSHPERDEDDVENPSENNKKPTNNKSDKPEKPTTDSDKKPHQTEPKEDDNSPSEPSVDEPVIPSQPETSKPSYKPNPPSDITQAPTEAPTATPWEPPTEEEVPPSIDYNSILIVRRLDADKVAASRNIYCALYDPNGILVGESNLYASSHIAEKGVTYGGKTVVRYYPYRAMDITVSGKYTYIFYGDNGDVIYQDTIRLSANV